MAEKTCYNSKIEFHWVVASTVESCPRTRGVWILIFTCAEWCIIYIHHKQREVWTMEEGKYHTSVSSNFALEKYGVESGVFIKIEHV